MGLAERADLVARLNLDGNFESRLRANTAALGRFQGSMGRVGRGVGQVGAGIGRAGVRIGAAVLGAGAVIAKVAADYEDAFAGVRKTVDATEPELAKLSDQFRALSREVPIAATEFARLGEIAGALGVNVDAIDEFAEVTAKLGVTTDLTADQAADALGRIGNILGLTAEDYDNFGSALVNLGNKGASTEPEIIEITKRFAAAGDQAGLTAQEILGLAEATASFTGLAPEAAGSSLSRLTGILTKVVAGGGAKFKTLNKIVGEDFKKALDKDASGALLDFLKGLGKLDKYERANALKELGLDSVYLRQLLGGLIANIDGVEASLANADAGWKGNFLNEEAAKKFDTLKQQVILLKNNLIDAGITIGTEFLPNLKNSVGQLIAALKVPGNQDTLKSIGRDIGKAIDSIKWGEVIQGAKDFVGILKGALGMAKGIFDVLNTLPTEVKAAGLGLIGLNKLSGGLIGSGIGNIVGGLAQGLTRALVSAGIGRAFVQPVFVTNMGVGGMGGGAGAAGVAKGGLGLISKVFLVGEAIGLALLVKDVADQVGAGSLVQAKAIHDTLTESLASPQTMAQLQQKLAGIDQGLDRMPKDPIGRAIFQSSIDELIKMRTETVAAIEALKLGGQRNKSGSPDDRDVSPAKRTLTGSVFTAEQRKQKIDWSKLHREQDTQQRKLTTLQQSVRDQKAAMLRKLEGTGARITSGGHGDADRIVRALYATRAVVRVQNTQTTIRVASGVTTAQRWYNGKLVPIG